MLPAVLRRSSFIVSECPSVRVSERPRPPGKVLLVWNAPMVPRVEEEVPYRTVVATHFGERFFRYSVGNSLCVLPPWEFEGFHVKHEVSNSVKTDTVDRRSGAACGRLLRNLEGCLRDVCQVSSRRECRRRDS